MSVCAYCDGSGEILESIDEEKYPVPAPCPICRAYCDRCRKWVRRNYHVCLSKRSITMPATALDIRNAIQRHQHEPGVESLIKWVCKWHKSSFYEALWEAIAKADETNLEKLERGFPDEVAAFHDWHYGDLADQLREEGLDI